MDTGIANKTITVSGITAAFDTAELSENKTVTLDKSGASITVAEYYYGEANPRDPDNYSVTIPDTTTASIKVIPLTISGVAMDAESYTYGDAVGYDSSALTISQPGGTAANAEDLVYTYTGTANDDTTWNSTTAPTKVGTYTLTVSHSDTEHYTGSQSVSFTISKASATVTAKELRYHIGTKLPDGSAPELGKHYTVEGLFGEDTVGTVTMKYQKDGAYVTPDFNMPGTYDILITVDNINPNYDISCVNGKLTYYSTTPAKYYPTIEVSEGGETTVNNTRPESGDKVTITPKPDAGYQVGEVIVTGKNGNIVEVIDNGDGTYSFKQPSGSVTIQVTFKPDTCPSKTYSDLDGEAWYHEAVDYVLHKGLMNGVGDDKFDPNGTTSRAMIVTILWRLEGKPVVNYSMDFEDIDADLWYTKAFRWAASKKIVEGWDGKFDPMGEITREQMATIMYRYARYKDCDTSVGEDTNILSYSDAFDAAEWAIPAMQWACGSGMIQGIADGNAMNLQPQGNATRAQSAAILQRYCENVAKED